MERYEDLSRSLKLRVNDYVDACEKIFAASNDPESQDIWTIVAERLAQKGLHIKKKF